MARQKNACPDHFSVATFFCHSIRPMGGKRRGNAPGNEALATRRLARPASSFDASALALGNNYNLNTVHVEATELLHPGPYGIGLETPLLDFPGPRDLLMLLSDGKRDV